MDGHRARLAGRFRKTICLSGVVALALAPGAAARSAEGQAIEASGPSIPVSDVGPEPQPALAPIVSVLRLLDRDGKPTNALSPLDTMYLEAVVENPGGFENVKRLDFDLYYQGRSKNVGQPAYHAEFRWRRDQSPYWFLIDPVGSTWSVLPDLCYLDLDAKSTGPQTVLLAFVPSRVTRFSEAGQWTAEVEVVAENPSAQITATLGSVNADAYFELSLPEKSGEFAGAAPGTAAVPLWIPSSGILPVATIANTTYQLLGSVTHMVRNGVPAETLDVEDPKELVSWEFAKGGGSGQLSTTPRLLTPFGQPNTADTLSPTDLQLTMDYPDSLPGGSYDGFLHLRIQRPSGTVGVSDSIGLTANLIGDSLAAVSATAEIHPVSVTAGTQDQLFGLDFLPTFDITTTGIDRIFADLPVGYGPPRVTGVTVSGLPVSFADSSSAQIVDVRLLAPLILPLPVEIEFAIDAPILADSVGSPFPVYFDDTNTETKPQAATEGDADGVADENKWSVTVQPGPLFAIRVEPDSVLTTDGASTAFQAVATDAFGNPLPAAVTWSVTGGIGTFDPGTGLFTAQAPGAGYLIAETGGLRDSAYIGVDLDSIAVLRTVVGPASASLGQTGLSVGARLENRSAATLPVLAVGLAFTRTSWGDADGEFGAVPDAANPDSLGPGESAWYLFSVDVMPWAVPGPVQVDASANLTVPGLGTPLLLVGADTSLALLVQTPPQISVAPGTLVPSLVAQGSSGVVFSIAAENTGQATLTLSTASALRILAPADTLVVPLAGSGEILGSESLLAPGSTATVLAFGPVDIPASFATGRHAVELALIGNDQNGMPYQNTTASQDSMTVASPAGGIYLQASQVSSQVNPGQKDAALFSIFLANSEPTPVVLQSLALDNTTVGPGSQAQRDAEFVGLRLYLDDGDGKISPLEDVLLSEQSVTGGTVTFAPLSLSVPDGAILRLVVGAEPSLQARDGDTLDVAVPDETHVTFDRAVSYGNTWPLDPPGGLAVDGMSAAQIFLPSLSDTGVARGSSRVLALAARVPANGYEADTLQGVRIANLGTAAPGTDVSRVEVWADGGDGLYQAGSGDDLWLGEATRIGAEWILTNLALPVPVAGQGIFVSVDLSSLATPGRTVQLRLPASPSSGLVMASANDGPEDASVAGERVITIQSTPGGTVSAAGSQSGLIVIPGGGTLDVFELDLTNDRAAAETLQTIVFTNGTIGPGTQAQLDAEWTPIVLHWPARFGGVEQLAQPINSKSGSFSGGQLVFSNLSIPIPAGETTTLRLVGGASREARDGDDLDLFLESPADLVFAGGTTPSGSWPISPDGAFPVDGLGSAQLDLKPVGFADFPTGSTRNLALDFLLPANGYEADALRRLDVVNLGSAVAGIDIARMELWRDDGDESFDPAADVLLAPLVFTGSRWELTGLDEPVAPPGRRAFVTVDVAQLAGEGRTVRLALPTLPDVALGMASDNDGPVDQMAANPFEQVVSVPDRVLVSAVALPSQSVAPGQGDGLLLHLAATNSYMASKTLVALSVENVTAGSGSLLEKDTEFEALELRGDGNGNGLYDGAAIDPLLATAMFSVGRASFLGLSTELPPDSAISLFLVADVSLGRARDGDVLRLEVAGSGDLGFSDATVVAASWPLRSAEWSVDGMVLDQITDFGTAGATLGPGDGPVAALDLLLPSNGYAADVLRGLTVANLGTAGPSDVGELRLWRDGGDGMFSGAGDDVDAGPLVRVGSVWQTPFLGQPLPPGGTRYFVALTVAGAPTDSTTVRLSVPVDGIAVDSGNDGPRDLPVVNPNTIVLSTSPLLAGLSASPPAVTLGQTVTARMVVRNNGAERITGVVPSALTSVGSGGWTPLGGPLPASVDLDAGSSDTLVWTYQATAAGEVRLQGSASGWGEVSGLPRSSPTAESNEVRLFTEAGELELFATESMPFSVNRGQTGVVPLHLTFTNPGDEEASDIRLRRLRLRLEDEFGGPIVPADLVSRVAVREGSNLYLERTGLETVGSEIDLTLATPVLISHLEPATLSLEIDVSDTTTASSFRVLIPDSTYFEAEDGTSGAPVRVLLQQGLFPVASGLARVGAEATRLDVSAVPAAAEIRASLGQSDRELLRLSLLNPGVTGLSSDARVASIRVALVDTSGVPHPSPASILDRIEVRSPLQTLVDRGLGSGDDTTIALSFSPLLDVPVNTPLEISLRADVADSAALGVYRLRLLDETTFDARDASTGSPLAVYYAADPLEGPGLFVERRADTVRVAGTPLFPPAAPAGRRDLAALRLSIRHPGAPATARVRLDGLALRLVDGGRAPLVPATFLTRLRILDGAVEVGQVLSPPASGNVMSVPLSGVLLDPGETRALDVIVDLEASAPAVVIELLADGEDVLATDANTGSSVAVSAEAAGGLPASSGLLSVQPPARTLHAGLRSLMPAALAADGTEIPVARVLFSNAAPSGASAISLDHLILRSSTRDGGGLALGLAASSVRLLASDGTPWAQSALLTPDSVSAVLVPAAVLDVEPQSPETLEVRVTLRAASGVESFRLGMDVGDVGVVQPGSALLDVTVEPEAGSSFPLWTESGSFSAVALEASYSNFPNPFHAGVEPTTFAYYLPTSGRVTLKIWTPRGDLVATLAEGSGRAPGLSQADVWDGRNGRGQTVRNGVYVAELVVDYDDGSQARVLRKVAVVR